MRDEWCVPKHGGQRSMSGVFLISSPPSSLRQGLSLIVVDCPTHLSACLLTSCVVCLPRERLSLHNNFQINRFTSLGPRRLSEDVASCEHWGGVPRGSAITVLEKIFQCTGQSPTMDSPAHVSVVLRLSCWTDCRKSFGFCSCLPATP